MKQDLFNFDEDEAPQKTYSWTWDDPLPEGLTERQYAVLEIKRELRHLEEAPADQHPYFAERVEKMRQAFKEKFPA